jgi:hypothetical protein
MSEQAPEQAPEQAVDPVAAAVDDTPAWPFPASDDAIVKAHVALRADLKDFAAALEAMEKAGEEPTPQASKLWMMINLKNWFKHFEHAVKHTLETEEKIFFPLLLTKVDAAAAHSPDEVSKAKLLALLNKLSVTLSARSAQAKFELGADKRALAALAAALEKHFGAVEAVALEALRAHFTRKETIWTLEKPMVDDGSAKLDAGWMLCRAFPNDEARNEWLHRVPEISVERRKNVDIPGCHAYAKKYQRLLDEILSGKHERSVNVAAETAQCCVIA